MKKLSARGRLWLKSIHVIVSVILVGGAACILVLRAVAMSDGAHLHALDHAILLVEQGIIIPAASGALLTGFLECWLTNWGFVRYRWIIVKWVVLLSAILIGSLWLGPWASRMETISDSQGLRALANPVYLQLRLMHSVLFGAQTLALVALPFISVIKPWMNRPVGKRTTARVEQSLTAGSG